MATKLSTLRARVGASKLRMERRTVNPGATNVYDVWDFKAGNGRTLFTVNVDDLFDADGNTFEDDSR